MKKTKKTESTIKTIGKIFNVVLAFLVVFAVLAYATAKWYIGKYGDIGFDSILFTMFSELSGVESGLVVDYICKTLVVSLLAAALIVFLLFFRSDSAICIRIKNKTIRLYPFSYAVRAVLCLAFFGVFTLKAANLSGLTAYIKVSMTDSKIFDSEYVYPAETQLTFPENKRNLIYIFLESMETTFFDTSHGGAYSENIIPELYSLAESNVNFSQNGGVGGCQQCNGATWTVGAMVAQSAGVPLKLPSGIEGNEYGRYSEFLPGVVTLSDILNENGYYQALVIGSNASFGGRDRYYSQHSADSINDFYSARTDGIIDDDYWNNWWGMEDKFVYEYAKQCLNQASREEKPFAITILTADTHPSGGFVCDLCIDGHTDQYQTVYSCASRQLNDFIEWLKQQDFYENTTVIIVGDHCTMDNDYMTNTLGFYENRYIYNCFLNSAVEPVNSKNRVFTQLDMFPSTLAAMGVQIEGNRLGMGVNLFSDEQTLAEKYGFDAFNSMINTKSTMYEYEFLYNKMNIS